MASISAVLSMGTPTPLTSSQLAQPKTTFFSPLPTKAQRAVTMGQLRPNNARGLKVQASLKEKAVVSGLTAAALTAAMVVPEAAQAAELVPSLKNFLLSIVSGGVVLGGIFGAVIAVSNFDPVKRT